MTLDESDKQQQNEDNNSSNNNETGRSETIIEPNNNQKDLSTAANDDVHSSEQSSSEKSTTIMEWASDSKNPTTSNEGEELNNNNKSATNKRTFDQIEQTSSSKSESFGDNIKASKDDNNNCSNIKPVDSTTNDEMVVDESNEEIINLETKTDDSTSLQGPDAEELNEKNRDPEPVSFKVVYAKEIYDVTFDLNDTILMLKNHLNKLTSVTLYSQKLCYKGNLDDKKTLKECGIKDGVKVMMIGSKANDILSVVLVTKDTVAKNTKEPTPTKEPLCQQKQHKKIIDKGVPEQVMQAWLGEDCALPLEPLTGMLNKYGNKVRLTFKLELDEVWISTKERTQKIQMTSIKSVISEPIENYQNYHIMALQIGPTEASRIWFYWVPAQYIRAIKNVILNS